MFLPPDTVTEGKNDKEYAGALRNLTRDGCSFERRRRDGGMVLMLLVQGLNRFE
jgi:hypothetical protein